MVSSNINVAFHMLFKICNLSLKTLVFILVNHLNSNPNPLESSHTQIKPTSLKLNPIKFIKHVDVTILYV